MVKRTNYLNVSRIMVKRTNYLNVSRIMVKRTNYLNVSRIMVKRTNLPRSGTTREVGGMISASSRKNTVRDNRIEIDRDT
jgi:hypothetical protein